MNFKDSGLMKAVTFSYDDGITQDVRLIDLLNKYGLKCTFNINSELLGSGLVIIRNNKKIAHYKLKPENVKDVYEGHEVAVHTLKHPNLTTCDDAEIIRQVEEDRKNLSELCGYEVLGMAYPGGGVNNNEHVADVIRKSTSVKFCRTTTCTESFEPQDDLFRFNPTEYHLNFDSLMTLGREFIEMKPDSPKIFYIWGHSYEMDYESEYWAKLEEFLKLISGHDDIFYGTNSEVLL